MSEIVVVLEADEENLIVKEKILQSRPFSLAVKLFLCILPN